jgi:tRNA-specific 2-thiouridylase
MDREFFDAYLDDASHAGEPLAGGFDGAAGGAPCGDLIRVSIAVQNGAISAVTVAAEGCAAARAAATAVAERADGAPVLDAGLIGPHTVAAALGGIGPQGHHAVELAADALHRALGAAAGSDVALADPPGDGERVLVAL